MYIDKICFAYWVINLRDYSSLKKVKPWKPCDLLNPSLNLLSRLKSTWWKGCHLSLWKADSVFNSLQQNVMYFPLKVWIYAWKKGPKHIQKKINDHLLLRCVNTLTMTVMAEEMEVWNDLLLCDDKQVWRAKQVISAAWLGPHDAWKRGKKSTFTWGVLVLCSFDYLPENKHSAHTLWVEMGVGGGGDDHRLLCNEER